MKMTHKSTLNISRWLDEDKDDDFIDGPADSDDDIDHVEEEIETSGSEYKTEEEDNPDVEDLDWETVFNVIEGPSSKYHVGLEGTKWMKEPIEARLLLQDDYIPNVRAGPSDYATTRNTPSECFDLFFDESIRCIIAKNTNARIIEKQKEFSRERDAKLTDEVEIKALLGILFLCGSIKPRKEAFLQMFDSKKGIGLEAVYLAMSAQRYRFLMKNLRFHNPLNDQIAEDKMAPIRDLFQIVVNNFQKHFTPSHELTLDELYTPYQGRCGFRVHTPRKTLKYGIKMYALVDCQYPYTYNLELYVGDNPGLYEVSNKKVDVVVRMTNAIQGEYRNVTFNNKFTSLEVAETLFEKKITIVGSVRPNKKEVPRVFRSIQDKDLYNSLFGFSHVTTLVQYVSKPDRAVLLMSTMHNDGAIDEKAGDSRQPKILTFYNRTKSAVEIVDSLCSKIDVTRNSRRWPLTILFRLMNLAAINALCIYTLNRGHEKVVRREFQMELATSMIKPLIQRRLNVERIPKAWKQKMADFLNVPVLLTEVEEVKLSAPEPKLSAPVPAPMVLPVKQPEVVTIISNPSKAGTRGRCHVCRKSRHNKSTRDVCMKCKKFTCLEHIKIECICCYNNTKHSRGPRNNY